MSTFAVPTRPQPVRAPDSFAPRAAAPCWGGRCSSWQQHSLRQRAWGTEWSSTSSSTAQTRALAQPPADLLSRPRAGHDFGLISVHAGPDHGVGVGMSSRQDRSAQAHSRNPDDLGSGDEVLTKNGGNAASAIAGGVAGAIGGAVGALAGAAAGIAAGATPVCAVAAGPSYAPTGTIPVTTSGGRKRASFSMAASFDRGACFSCCQVRQYIKWDTAFHTWKGGPPHSGFPSSATAGTWYEDRDTSDKRYGHRSGTHSDPRTGCGDEYRTGTTHDQARGYNYCGRDTPSGPTALTGQFQFQLKVIDTSRGDAVRANSSVITVNW